jgi:hypothetical protein
MFHIPYLNRVPLSRLGVFLSMPTTWPDNLTRTLACSLSLSLIFVSEIIPEENRKGSRCQLPPPPRGEDSLPPEDTERRGKLRTLDRTRCIVWCHITSY